MLHTLLRASLIQTFDISELHPVSKKNKCGTTDVLSVYFKSRESGTSYCLICLSVWRLSVCLSICPSVYLSLCHRTWEGPSWSGVQSLQTVLLSIQSLMNATPYQNEPGYESEVCLCVHNYVVSLRVGKIQIPTE